MWNEIKNEKDIENLMNEYGGFHDSCIVSVNYQSGTYVDRDGGTVFSGPSEHSVNMVIHSEWFAPVELRFIGVRKCSIVGWQDDFCGDIYGAHIGFHSDLLGKTRDDKLIVWADKSGFDPSDYTEENIISRSGNNHTYVVAEKMFWRFTAEEI